MDATLQYLLLQILMSVQLVLMTVIRSVLTLMGPTLVPVTVDIHWTAMEEHAMIYLHVLMTTLSSLMELVAMLPLFGRPVVIAGVPILLPSLPAPQVLK
jgi:hypothetical protein